MEYRIRFENWEKFTKKMTTFTNKANKYGCDFKYEVLGEEFEESTNEFGGINTIKYIVVDVEGISKIADWEFISMIEYKNGGTVITGKSVETPKRYWDAPCKCEHCMTNRFRKSSFIVRNTKTHEFKQVGKTCLKDYTNGIDGEAIARIYGFINECTVGTGRSEVMNFYHVDTMLKYGVACVDKLGYKKSDNGSDATKFDVKKFYDLHNGNLSTYSYRGNESEYTRVRREAERINFPTREVIDEINVESIKEFISNMDNNSQYANNLKTIANGEYTEWKYVPILISVIPCYYRAIEKEIKRKEQRKADMVSNHVGNINDRIVIHVKEARCVSSYETRFGYSFFYKIVDYKGNIYMWSTSNANIIDDDNNCCEWLKATVKEHSEYRGIKQTMITRCTIKGIKQSEKVA